MLIVAAFISSLANAAADSRSAHPLSSDGEKTIAAFEPAQSAALFVGVRRFPYDKTITEVPYAVDDAIDLACVLALDPRVHLVDPPRVILALSGEPQKPESIKNLERLIAAGAQMRSAGGPDILKALDEQASAVGSKGVLILAFATHGFSKDGTQYLLTATSILHHRQEAISENEIRDIASEAGAARSLILVDACRDRVSEDRRSGGPDPQSAAPLLQAMAGVHGQVVLSAAAAGQYAYDDDNRRNGVFTAAVIDGLNCQASGDEHGLVTADTLSSFVEQRVLGWIRKHRDPRAARATQVSSEGSAKTMPLAACHGDAMVGKAATNAVAAPASRVLLSDGFDDNHNHWYVSNDPEAPAGVQDGAYVLGSKAFEFRFTTVGPLLDQNADFQISVTARRLRGGREHDFGLVWGLADRSNFFYFSINGEGHVTLGVLEGGRMTPLTDPTAVDTNVRTDVAANRLRIAKVGSRLRFFVNEALVHEMDFQPFFGRGVGFAAFNGPIVAAFDDLLIEGREPPQSSSRLASDRPASASNERTLRVVDESDRLVPELIVAARGLDDALSLTAHLKTSVGAPDEKLQGLITTHTSLQVSILRDRDFLDAFTLQSTGVGFTQDASTQQARERLASTLAQRLAQEHP